MSPENAKALIVSAIRLSREFTERDVDAMAETYMRRLEHRGHLVSPRTTLVEACRTAIAIVET